MSPIDALCVNIRVNRDQPEFVSTVCGGHVTARNFPIEYRTSPCTRRVAGRRTSERCPMVGFCDLELIEINRSVRYAWRFKFFSYPTINIFVFPVALCYLKTRETRRRSFVAHDVAV